MLNKIVTMATANAFRLGALLNASGTPTLQASNPVASCALHRDMRLSRRGVKATMMAYIISFLTMSNDSQ